MLLSLILGVAFAAPPVTITLPAGQAEVWASAIALHDVQLVQEHGATVRLVDLGARWELTVRGHNGPVRRVVSEPRTDAAREDLLSLARTLLRQTDTPKLSRLNRPPLPPLPTITASPSLERAPSPVVEVRVARSSGAPTLPAALPPAPLPSFEPVSPREVTLGSNVVEPRPPSSFAHVGAAQRRAVFVETGLFFGGASRPRVDGAFGLGASAGVSWGPVVVRAGALLTQAATVQTLEPGSTLRERQMGLGVELRPTRWPVSVGVRAGASERRFALYDQTISAHWQATAGPSLTVSPRVGPNVRLRGSVSGQRDLWRTILFVDNVASGALRPWRWVVQVGVVRSTAVRRRTKIAHE